MFGAGPHAVQFPGTTTDVLVGPAGLGPQLTSGIDLRFRFTYRVEANLAVVALAAAIAVGQRTFQVYTTTTGTIVLGPANSAGTILTVGGATAALLGNPAVGDWLTLRFTYDTATGRTTSYRSADNGATWTELFGQVNPTTPWDLQVDPAWPLRTFNSVGQLAWLDLRTYDGTPLASCDLSWPWPATTYADGQGNTWTLQGTGWQWTGPLTIATAALPDATVGQPYQAQLAAAAGTPPYTWAITEGGLPGGLTLDPATGQITGTPL